MKVIWSRRAERERWKQIAYIGERNPRAAIAIGDIVQASTRRLADLPYSARSGRVPETQELVIPDTPFILVYCIEKGEVTIVRFLHEKLSWPQRK